MKFLERNATYKTNMEIGA